MKPFITEYIENGHTYLRMQVEGMALTEIAQCLIGEPIEAIYIFIKDELSSFWRMFIKLTTGSVLQISASETVVVGWNEMGTINIAFLGEASIDLSFYKKLNFESFIVSRIRILEYTEDLVSTECGILLEDPLGRNLTLASGELPFRLSASMPNSNAGFSPRYPIESCKISDIT